MWFCFSTFALLNWRSSPLCVASFDNKIAKRSRAAVHRRIRYDVRNRDASVTALLVAERKSSRGHRDLHVESSRYYFVSRARRLRPERKETTAERTMHLGVNLHDEPLAFGTNVLSRWKARLRRGRLLLLRLRRRDRPQSRQGRRCRRDHAALRSWLRYFANKLSYRHAPGQLEPADPVGRRAKSLESVCSLLQLTRYPRYSLRSF